MKINILREYKNKKIAILGFGKEGRSALKLLKTLEFSNITILDKNKICEHEKNIKYIDSDLYIENLKDFDLIIKSPGVSPYKEKIINYRDKIISPVSIFCANYKGKVIGITGTKGKSTISTLLYTTLRGIGESVKLVGNIGNPVLDEINILEQERYNYIVFEISSYMLEDLDPHFFIGYLNNLYDCHLDWHQGKINYTQAKLNIIKNSENKIANIETKSFLKSYEDIHYFGIDTNLEYKEKTFLLKEKPLFKDGNIALQGEHNRHNITGIISILHILYQQKEGFSKSIQVLQACLETFQGLPHRIQNIGSYNNITFIDDAIATTPQSTIAAIKTFEYNIGTLILGGEDSGFQFDELRMIIKKYNIKNIILFPDTGEKIFNTPNIAYETISHHSYENDYHFNVLKTRSMKHAIDFAFTHTPAGKICLLSTAAPSFSIWKNGYIEKADDFLNEIKNHHSL